MTTDHAVKVLESGKRVVLIVDRAMDTRWLWRKIWALPSTNPRWAFTVVHNKLAVNRIKDPIIVHRGARVDPTAVLGVPGCRYVKGPEGQIVEVAHVGGIKIEPQVSVGALSIVHRAVLDNTVLRVGAKIGSMCTIGHGATVGEDTILTVRVTTGGSSVIGKRCWFGMGSMVKQGVTVCDDVLVGAGAVVTRDIDRPGVYAGIPAKYIRPWDGTW